MQNECITGGAAREKKHLQIERELNSLEKTLERFNDFRDELLGNSKPKDPECGKKSEPSFSTVMITASERITGVNSQFVIVLKELRDIVL